ncbi:MAG: hypothetical protein JWR26_2857 [Pedosphaera sp.]|nr:hypothetical protein [Pedosphaera sp.]
MKNNPGIKIKLAALALAFTTVVPSLHAQLTLPSAVDGTDGALIINSSTNIDLSQAGTGSWTNSSAKPGFGTYDPAQWAVVFKYSSVSIASGATVSFVNNATHAPVVWLVQSNVVINANGAINLDGQPDTGGATPAEPGPGGFRGGVSTGGGMATGFGPGGGYATVGYYSSTHAYGNPQILPLIGGSSGEGEAGWGGGGAGGGAMLIAAGGAITVNGSCHANGGGGSHHFVPCSGSGGGIRLVANQILGGGTLSAGGSDSGRIRLECTNTTFGLSSINPTPTTLTLSGGATPAIFPANNAPTATILSVSYSGQTNFAPADPRAALAVSGNDDIRIVTTNSTVVIQVKTTNFPTNGTVNVYVRPITGLQTVYPLTAPVSGDSNAAIWQVSAPLPYPAHSIIQARAVY